MMARKDKVVAENTRGVAFLFRKNKVEHVKGAARFLDATHVEVAGRALQAKRGIIVATGSDSVPLPGVEIDEKTILSSRPARCRSQPCRAASSWSAAAISGSSWARCGSGSAPRSPWSSSSTASRRAWTAK